MSSATAITVQPPSPASGPAQSASQPFLISANGPLATATEPAAGNAASFTDTGLPAGTAQSWRPKIVETNTGVVHYGPYVTINTMAPGVLTAPTHDAYSVDVHYVPAAGGTGAHAYALEWRVAGETLWLPWGSGGTATDWTVDGLESETTYEFRVHDTDAGAGEVYSNTVSVTTSVIGDTTQDYTSGAIDGPVVATGNYAASSDGSGLPGANGGELIRRVQSPFKLSLSFFGSALALQLWAGGGADFQVKVGSGAYQVVSAPAVSAYQWVTLVSGLARNQWHEVTIQYTGGGGNAFLRVDDLLRVTGPAREGGASRFRLPNGWSSPVHRLPVAHAAGYIRCEGFQVGTDLMGFDECWDFAADDASVLFYGDIDELWGDVQESPSKWFVERDGIPLGLFSIPAGPYWEWHQLATGLSDGQIHKYLIIKSGAGSTPYADGRITTLATKGGTGIQQTVIADRKQVFGLADSFGDMQRRTGGDGTQNILRLAMDLANCGGLNGSLAGANASNLDGMIKAVTQNGAGLVPLIAMVPDVVVIAVGINDASLIYNNTVIGGSAWTAARYRAAIVAACDLIHALWPAARIRLCYPSHYGSQYADAAGMNTVIDTQIIPALDAVPALTVAGAGLVAAFAGWVHFDASDVVQSTDHLHPEPVAAQADAPTFAAVLTAA